MKANFEDGRLVLQRNGGTVPSTCPFTMSCCSFSCPHLDDSDPSEIRLTCGGTDVFFERHPVKQKN